MKCSKYSEVAVPMLVGSNPTEGGGFFQKEGTSAGPWMCVYVSSGLTVGWWKEDQHSFGHHRELIKKTSYLDTWRYKRFEIQTVYSSTLNITTALMLLSSFPLISVCHCVNISNSFWYRNFDFVGTIWYFAALASSRTSSGTQNSSSSISTTWCVQSLY
jgi:hypothetical protein